MDVSIPTGFLSAEDSRRYLHVSDVTLRAWAKEGKIEFSRPPGKCTHRRYNVRKFLYGNEETSTESSPSQNRQSIIYARVSTRGQSENLERQTLFLREKYPNHKLITDIASGINFKRKGLNTILELAFKGQLQEVVVAYKDRFCRFGFELFEHIFKSLSNAKIVVLHNRETSPNEELVEDILSIVTVFSARINGRKKYGKRKSKEPDSPNISFVDSETDN